jgi:hypothetical protein
MHALISRGITLALPAPRQQRIVHIAKRPTKTQVICAVSGDLQPPGTTADRANRTVERYTARMGPRDLIAGGANTREENQ